MGITLFFFVLAPLCALWVNRPDRLLQLVLLTGIFEAGAAVTIGGLGIAPNTLPAVTIIGYVAMQVLLGARYPGVARVWRLAFPLILVALWAVALSWIAPRLFEDQVYIWPQKSTPPFVLTPLSPSTANLHQNLYLILNITLCIVVAVYATRSSFAPVALLRSYLASLPLALFFGVWQFGSRVAHLPFPSSVLYSNPGWSILTEQSIGALPRINATFSEPSSFGGYMAAGAFCCGWLMLNQYPGKLVKIAFMSAIFGVFLSTSATGIVSLFAGAILVTLMGVTTHARRFLPVIKRLFLPAVLSTIVITLLVIVLLPSVVHNLEVVIGTVLDKQDSDSYNARSSTDLDSIQAAMDTFGIGVGWGNNRSSSLIPGLLATVGILGVFGLVWFGLRLAVRVRRIAKRPAVKGDVFLVQGCCGAIVGYLVPACLSAPTITAISFFALLGLLIAGVVRSEIFVRISHQKKLPVPSMAETRPVALG